MLFRSTEQQEKLQAELEQMTTSVKESEMLLQSGNTRRIELESKIALMKKEVDKSQEELNRMRHLKNEQEATIGVLQSEMETLKAHSDEMKHSLSEDEAEKERLRKHVFQLKNELKKRDDAVTSMEKKLKDSNGRTAVSDATKTTVKNNRSPPAPRGSKEVAGLREKIKLLEVNYHSN